ncbi:MAG: hypothetical protein JNM72_12325 [Deltaproteobacteria bacterium]|nr:hypothetical protein [Deltaproteobacteria bacterium]
MSERPAIPRWATPLILALLVGLQLLPALADPRVCLADPASELPVKLWVYETFASPALLLGGPIEGVGWPTPGPLNNPDLLGTLVVGGLGPLIGACLAWDLLAGGLALANGLAAAALARQWLGAPADRGWAPLVAGVGVALMPFLWVHCVASAILDVMNLWPYLWSLHQLRAAVEGRDAGAALRAGLLLGLGFELCPYNLLVFLPLLPAMAALITWRGPAAVGLRPLPTLPEALRLLGATALGAALLGLPVLAWTQTLMDAPGSQMSRGMVAASRHGWPFAQLHPAHEQYVATLVEWLSPGEWGLRHRENVALFHRAVAPGWAVLGLAAAGCALPGPLRGAARLWAGLGLLGVLLSLGPFLPITEGLASPTPVNLAWLSAFWTIPGQDLLLEPFRYAAPAAVCFAVAAAAGAAALEQAGARPAWFGLACAGLVALDLRLLAPHLSPPPTALPEVPAAYAALDELLPPGPIIDLPFFHEGGNRFRRAPFFYALRHKRPIPNAVAGFVPPLFRDNGLLRSLLQAEGHEGPHQLGGATAEERAAGAEQLVAAGFVGLIVDPEAYVEPARAAFVRAELRAFGAPIERDGRWIWRLQPGAP